MKQIKLRLIFIYCYTAGDLFETFFVQFSHWRLLKPSSSEENNEEANKGMAI